MYMVISCYYLGIMYIDLCMCDYGYASFMQNVYLHDMKYLSQFK